MQKLFVTLLCTLFCAGLSAQIDLPAASPGVVLTQTIGTTKVTFDYSRPSVKGRKIFGDLVAYGKVWRTGANRITNLTFDKDVQLNGQKVAAGTYGFATIPGEKEWTVILNSDAKQWGVYQYDEKKDVLRFKVPAEMAANFVEHFTIGFEGLSGTTATAVLSWEKTAVRFKIDAADVSGGRVEASPAASVSQAVGLSKVTVNYNRPAVKGRQIFGGLVPYGQVWRTGANKVTDIKFDTDVTFNGQKVAAGTYALLSIPGEKEWTVILNSDAQQWGAYGYDSKKDVLRTTVKPEMLGSVVENFTIGFDKFTPTKTTLVLSWDKTSVSVPVEHDPHEQILAKIKEETAKPDAKSDTYFTAAEYYRDHDLDLKQALVWSNKVLETDKAWWSYYLRASIYAKLGQCKEAKADATVSQEGARKDGDDSYVKMNQKILDTKCN